VDGRALGFDAFGAVASTVIRVDFGPMASRTFLLLFWGTFLLLTSIFLAAVSVGFGNELVASVVAFRLGIARNQSFGFATAAVNSRLHGGLARFTNVSVVVVAGLVFVDGTFALIHLLFSIDLLSNGAWCWSFALFRHTRGNIRFALIAVNRFAFAAGICLAFFAVWFFEFADPFFAAALKHLIALRRFEAFVAVQQLLRLLLCQTFLAGRASSACTWPWFSVWAYFGFSCNCKL